MKPETKENYMKSILGEAEYEANLEDWKEEGIAEGRAEGRAEGHAAGMAEGKAESKREVAGKMKADGLEISLIAKYSGLTVEEVKAL